MTTAAPARRQHGQHTYAGRLADAYPGGPIEREILVCLALHLNHKRPDEPVCPGNQRIVSLTGCSLRNVQYALRKLENEGWITTVGDRKRGRATSARFVVNLARLDSGEFPPRSQQRSAARASGDGDENPARGAAFQGLKPGTDGADKCANAAHISTGKCAREAPYVCSDPPVMCAKCAPEQEEITRRGNKKRESAPSTVVARAREAASTPTIEPALSDFPTLEADWQSEAHALRPDLTAEQIGEAYDTFREHPGAKTRSRWHAWIKRENPALNQPAPARPQNIHEKRAAVADAIWKHTRPQTIHEKRAATRREIWEPLRAAVSDPIDITPSPDDPEGAL